MGRIVRLSEIADQVSAAAEAEAIFWESAGTQDFATETDHAAYRDLWFGRYIRHAPGEFFLASGAESDIHGYLAGSFISDAPPLPGPDYYPLFSRALIARCPAHIHVNVRADRRGAGIGAQLASTFLGHCRINGIAGAHAITAAGSRSAAFFQKCGFASLARTRWHDRELVFLAADL